jgi:hypothetical protein
MLPAPETPVGQDNRTGKYVIPCRCAPYHSFVDDETYIRARIAGFERDTSVSALMKAFLEQFA